MKTKQNNSFDKITDLVNLHIQTLFPGCLVGCANSAHRFSYAFGTHTNATKKMAVSNIFDIASVTKAILNIITLKLIPFHELDQKIIDVVPMRGKYRNQISVRHLLTFAVEYGDVKLSALCDKDEMLVLLINGDLSLPPGNTYRYTNISSMLLTFFLEKKFDTTLEILVRRFCNEIGMTKTGFYPFSLTSLDEMIITEEGLGEGTVQDESARLYGKPIGSAGLFSTVDDLLIFGQSFLGEKPYLSKRLIKKMPVSQFRNDAALTFGLGMGLRHQNECDLTNPNGTPMVVLKKNGFSGVHFCVLPENDFCFVVFGNICYPKRPTAEKRDLFTRFHRKLLRICYEDQLDLF